MNCIDVCNVRDCVPDEAELARTLRAKGYSPLPASDAGTTRYEVENDVALDELLARLESHGAAADIFLPIRFEAAFAVRNTRYASVEALLQALGALRDELELDVAREDRSRRLGRQRSLWRTFRLAAKEAKTERCCIVILRDI